MKASAPRNSKEASPFMSLRQVMEIVPVSRSSIYLMIKYGEFPAAKKLGRRAAAWSKKEVAAWIERKLK